MGLLDQWYHTVVYANRNTPIVLNRDDDDFYSLSLAEAREVLENMERIGKRPLFRKQFVATGHPITKVDEAISRLRARIKDFESNLSAAKENTDE